MSRRALLPSWVYVLAVLCRGDVPTEGLSTTEVMRRAFEMSGGSSSIYLGHVRDVLDRLDDSTYVERRVDADTRGTLLWRVRPAGRDALKSAAVALRLVLEVADVAA